MTRLRALPAWCLAVAFAMSFAVAAPAAALDADLDGVADTVDQCPTTPVLDLVNSTGCSVCPCEAAWATHQAYVDCVTAEAYARFNAGLLTRTKRNDAITHAKSSTCGTVGVTRCCTWKRLITGSMGTCSLLAPSRCTFAILGKWAEDRSTGSCYYNPCTW